MYEIDCLGWSYIEEVECRKNKPPLPYESDGLSAMQLLITCRMEDLQHQ